MPVHSRPSRREIAAREVPSATSSARSQSKLVRSCRFTVPPVSSWASCTARVKRSASRLSAWRLSSSRVTKTTSTSTAMHNASAPATSPSTRPMRMGSNLALRLDCNAVPHRPLPKDVNFPKLEEEVLERWREHDVYRESLRRREGAPTYTFYEGPPTANGRPGSHHVLARVFKDIFPRYKTMRGYYSYRKGGWDCHGLPVEIAVQKTLGIESKQEIEEYGIAEFNARCRESVFEFLEDWTRLTERIGYWVDLDDPYRTLDAPYVESVWWALRQLWEKDLLYEGFKVVPYCPRDGTALSSHEVSQGYADVEDPSV